MSQPEVEPMNTTEAEQAIEGFLEKNSLTEGGEEEVEQAEETEEVEAAKTDESEEDKTSDEETEETSESENDDEEEQDSIETLSELAEALETPLEEMMANLKTVVKVNGEEITVTLKDAFDGYQKDADYRQKTTELSQQRKVLEEQQAGARQELERELIQIGQLMEALQQAVAPQLDQAELNYLKQTDPQAYLIKTQEHNERVEQFKQLQQQAANQFQHNRQQLAQQQQVQQQEILARAAADLQTRLPDWSEDVKKSLDDYLMGEAYGYTDEELSQVIDPRLVEIARKAQLYDQQSQKANIASKKVKNLPKVQPKGAQKAVKPNASKLKEAKAKLRKSGNIDDAASAVEQLLFT